MRLDGVEHWDHFQDETIYWLDLSDMPEPIQQAARRIDGKAYNDRCFGICVVHDLATNEYAVVTESGTSPEVDAMELAAAMALSSALREFRQMGKVVSPQQGAERLRQSIQPHHNRGSLKNRADEIAMELQRILAQKASAGICGRESKESLAYRWLELAASCAKVPIRYEADQIKQRQKEEQAQRGAGPVME